MSISPWQNIPSCFGANLGQALMVESSTVCGLPINSVACNTWVKLGHYWTLRACIRDWQQASLQTSNCSSCREGWMNEWVTNTVTTSAQDMLLKCSLLALPRWQLSICALIDPTNWHSPGLGRNSSSWGPSRAGSSNHTKRHLFIAQKQKKASCPEGCQAGTSTSTQSFLEFQEGKNIWLFLIPNILKSLKARKMGTQVTDPASQERQDATLQEVLQKAD